MPNYDEALAQGEVKAKWSGAWIWTDAAPARNAYVLLRRPFRLHGRRTVEIDITADSFYTLYCDGERVGRGPARCSWG